MSDLWLDEAKRLPLGGKSYTHCPACNTDKKLGIYHDRDAYRASCHKCHWRGYEKRGQLSFAELQKYRRNERKFEQGGVAVPPLKGDIPPHARFWFLKAGIDVELAQEYGIGYSESMDRVILPVYTNGVLEAVQARALRKDQVPKYLNSEPLLVALYFNLNRNYIHRISLTTPQHSSSQRISCQQSALVG